MSRRRRSRKAEESRDFVTREDQSVSAQWCSELAGLGLRSSINSAYPGRPPPPPPPRREGRAGRRHAVDQPLHRCSTSRTFSDSKIRGQGPRCALFWGQTQAGIEISSPPTASAQLFMLVSKESRAATHPAIRLSVKDSPGKG